MPRQSDLRYTFEPSGGADFEVVEFTLDEGLSKPFTLALQLASFDAELDFGTLLDKPALLTIWRGDTPVRYVHGLISSLTQGDTGFRRTRYSVVVEPALARTRLCSNWRIFQQQTVPQILDTVLKAHGLNDVEQRLSYDHQPREYCVQAGENDLEFIARLAAEEGLLYTFEHRADGHRLIVTDRVSAIGTIEPKDACNVLYQAMGGGDQPEPALHRFHYTEQVRTARQVQRDYTFTHPRYDQEHIATGTQLEHQGRHYERFDYPGRYKRNIAGKPFTQTRLNALRSDARIAEVEGDDARLQPGKSFDLTDHPREDLNIRWRTVSIVHTGLQHSSQQEEAAGSASGTRYHLAATLAPAAFDWKAPLCPKPRIDGPQTATVVGPPGEEIFCDKWGRVKVSFPWDRASQHNEHSSCWIRVAQGWAGTTWGAMAIPRIGQELIVQYFDGDPDQPIATGRAYREANLPPYELPKHKTRMTIKSQTHKGDGFNELRFEDEKGVEEIYVHAEKDQNIHVNHNETTFVGNDRSEEVVRNEHLKVGEDRTRTVGGNEKIHIEGNRDQNILGASTQTVALAKTLSVGGLLNVMVGLNSNEQVALNKQLNVGQQLQITATDNISVTSRNGEVHIDSSSALILSCGGAFIKLANGRIEMGCPEPMLIHAATQVQAPARFGIPPPPNASEIEFRLVHPDGTPMAGNAFTATLSDGSQRTGVVDQEGYARLSNVTPGCSAHVSYHNSPAKSKVTACTELNPDLQQLIFPRHLSGGQS